MVKLTDGNCCDECRHDRDRPCPEMIACLTEGPLCHKSESCADKRQRMMGGLRRETLVRPAVFIGTGTCGLGAGAGKTLQAVRAWLEAKNIQADVVEVGCIGLCAVEPILDVQVPGRARVSFQEVSADKAPALLEAMLVAGQVPADGVLGQFRPGQQMGTGREKGTAQQVGTGTESANSMPIRSQSPLAGLEPWAGVRFLDEHPFFAPQTRWVLANCGIIDPARIEEYIARGGYRAFADAIRSTTPPEVCGVVEASGLRGRGGGGFPTGRKWRFALAAPAEQKYLICNADEGDPGAFMDRAVIEGDPHRVLEGMAIAAYAIGATKAYVYIRAEYPLAIKRIRAAIDQAKAYGLLGHNILDSGINLDVIIKMGAGAFVCGEETALIHSIEGRRGMPRPRPPFPAVQGLFGKPTVINNVETLANLPSILRNGAAWFSAVGTAGSKGTKVFALSGKINLTGLVEVAMGTPLRQIIQEIGGGIPNGKAFKGVQIGGPSGGCVPAQHLDIQIDYESLKAIGAMMGSGGLVVMDEGTCMVDMAKFFMDFVQRESCGKCIPCREGTRRMLEILKRITQGRASETGIDALNRFKGVMYLQRLAEVIRDTSLCGLGQSAPNPVLSTLRWFRDEYEAHVYERRCPAGACMELRRYRIDPAKCKGCTLCAKKCPAEAILGHPKSPHYVIPDKCIGCGSCLEACRFAAVVRE